MAMRKVTIAFINFTERTAKTGKNKGGKYISVGLKIDGFDSWINGYRNSITENWKKGDEIEIDIKKKEADGKTYFNFKMPSDKATKQDIIALDDRVRKLELELSVLNVKLGIGGEVEISQKQQGEAVEENLPI